MSDGGKGSARRPIAVEHEIFSNNWDIIFGPKKKEQKDNRRSCGNCQNCKCPNKTTEHSDKTED
jgi:hypothetical protein